tara:strand:+ start:59 stop:295 length:237 start_codon:yes stop_codon:yes gene_type:complete
MKKILLIIFIYLFFSQVSANDWRTKKGSFINNEFKESKKKSKVNDDIAEQLKTLHNLYKSGALSGYEYETAKKKILNN